MIEKSHEKNKNWYYVKVRKDKNCAEGWVDQKIVVTKKLSETVIKDNKIEIYKIIKEFSGKELKGTICNHPFLSIGYNFDVPMLDARFVTPEQGTGIVHCAPSHGPDDFNLCLNNGI